MKYVICYSGGVSSAECALTCAAKYGVENIILLNHDITARVERPDTKRFKQDVANFLGLPITYANAPNWEKRTPIQVIKDIGYFTNRSGTVLCTYELKTKPFYDWLAVTDPNKENVYVYGFDPNEPSRIANRAQKMGMDGYQTLFPMLWDESDIVRLASTGIQAPSSYDRFKHSNCTGCLKAGFQHWYVVYNEDRDMFNEVAEVELDMNFSLRRQSGKRAFLEDKRELFDKMIAAGVKPTEHINPQRFWADAKKAVKNYERELAELELSDQGVCLMCM
ncbi:hypothetical protein [Pseudoalteromonas ruthenica]|uniref:hypothetical protein n=1 Tax=Pseudoalteromonas ruthenica TaxID=151081 RepID=UPI00110B0CFF|nr:hypothetical protein [Pseudoalteromonas ruthenica]TMP23759.1 hypothetical protein CWC06_09400 [Pseudoalteromonas ruthenica]